MKSGKCLLLVFSSVLLLLGPLCSAYTKPAYGSAATLLTALTLELKSLTEDWEKSNQLLILSVADLERERKKAVKLQQRSERLQAKLDLYQTESRESSLQMSRISKEFGLLSQDLSELRKSLAARILKHRRQQIITGIIAAVTGAALGLIVGALALAR